MIPQVQLVRIGMMSKRRLFLLIFIFSLFFCNIFSGGDGGKNYKFLIYFKLRSIFDNPIFKWVKDNRLSDEIWEIERLLKFVMGINPDVEASLVSTDKGAYMIFFDSVGVDYFVKEINESSPFLLVKFNGNDIKVKLGDEFYHFLFRKKYFIFYKDGYDSFPFLERPNFLNRVGKRDFVIFFSPDVIDKLFKHSSEGNISKIVSSWEYVSLFPLKYDPPVFKILIKNKTISSSKYTEGFFSVLKTALGDVLKSSYFKGFKMDLSQNGDFTEIILSFPQSFSFH